MRISCETAAQCQELARLSKELIGPLVAYTVIFVVVTIAMYEMWKLKKGGESND